MPKRSPCWDCSKFPCKKPEKCDERFQYGESLKAGIQAVDMDQEYGFLPK